MYVQSFSMAGLLAAVLSFSHLTPLVAGSPLPESSDLITRAQPGCPSVKVMPQKVQTFYRTLTAPEIAGFEGGYATFVADNYSPNFTITDNTNNYPTYIKGKKRDVLGTWAKTGAVFAKGLSENLPKIRNVFDIKIVGDGNSESGTGSKCLQSTQTATFTAKLKKDFAGKKKGATFKFTHKSTLTIRFPNKSGGAVIDRVVMKQDWSSFWK